MKTVAQVREGSRGVAEAVARCHPQVVAAYPITPQTHIVEYLAQMVADGELQAAFVNVDSEHSAASVVLGASATGARVYTASSAQGLFLMSEVLFNIAGLRLPVILTCANRALSAPINIWNDQQDSVTMRDSGWIQLYAEDNQEALDLHIQAYRVAEHPGVRLPVMVAMDGYVLTHAYEPLEVPSAGDVDAFLPPYRPECYLDPGRPLTIGGMAGPDLYHEIRYTLHRALRGAQDVIEEVAAEFVHLFGRGGPGLVQAEGLEDCEVAVVAMGSVVATVREAAQTLRLRGKRVGVAKIRTYRPFPTGELKRLLAGVPRVCVLEKDISLGAWGGLLADVRSALYPVAVREGGPRVMGFVAGLGGRDVTPATVAKMIELVLSGEETGDPAFLDLDLRRAGGGEQ